MAAAEPVERRGGAKENAELQSTVRTQSREAVSQAQVRIREAVIRNRQSKLTALLHHINVDVLRASFSDLKKTAAPGVEGEISELDERLTSKPSSSRVSSQWKSRVTSQRKSTVPRFIVASSLGNRW